jgi:hypothetical protein
MEKKLKRRLEEEGKEEVEEKTMSWRQNKKLKGKTKRWRKDKKIKRRETKSRKWKC